MAFSQLYYGTKMFNTLSGPIVLSHVNWLLQAEVVSLCLTAQESVGVVLGALHGLFWIFEYITDRCGEASRFETYSWALFFLKKISGPV